MTVDDINVPHNFDCIVSSISFGATPARPAFACPFSMHLKAVLAHTGLNTGQLAVARFRRKCGVVIEMTYKINWLNIDLTGMPEVNSKAAVVVPHWFGTVATAILESSELLGRRTV